VRKIPGHERLLEGARARNPRGRLTRPEDVAGALVALAAPGCGWLTGNVIRVDGGEGIAA
jgi:NAD(P)-dependent dehydrogenase (short-subunit alcohol dehydrogenase family)